MIICLKRSKFILTVLVVISVAAAAVVIRHFHYENTAKAESTAFENQTMRDKALVYLFTDRIQEQSDEFYALYYTISPTIVSYFTSVKEVREDDANLYITFTTLPYIGPHDTIGEDEITLISGIEPRKL